MSYLRELQDEIATWGRKNSRDHTERTMLLTLMDELGELTRSVLKRDAGIRSGDNDATIYEAVGDIAFTLIEFCNYHDIDVERCLHDVWTEVRKMDWADKKIPVPNQKTRSGVNYKHSYHEIYEIEPNVWESQNHFDIGDLLPSRFGPITVEVVTVHDDRSESESVSDRIKKLLKSYPGEVPVLSNMSVSVQTEDNGKFVEIEVSRGTMRHVGFISVLANVSVQESTELMRAMCLTVSEFLKQLFGAIE